jgi:hypothetical protein
VLKNLILFFFFNNLQNDHYFYFLGLVYTLQKPEGFKKALEINKKQKRKRLEALTPSPIKNNRPMGTRSGLIRKNPPIPFNEW